MSIQQETLSTLSDPLKSSFWDLKQYFIVVKRLENASRLCSDVANFVHERANIEKHYANELNKFASRWRHYIKSGPEYGTSKETWTGFCGEAEKVAKLHLDMRERLVTEIESDLKMWQRSNYPTASFPPNSVKEARHIEQKFKSAQAPWATLTKTLQKAKRDYYKACKNTRSCNLLIHNARNDPSISSENHRKLQDRVTAAQENEERALRTYNDCLNALNADQRRYIMEMTKVFDLTQDYEKQRLEFFTEIYSRTTDILDTSLREELSLIYEELRELIKHISINNDLFNWSYMFGADMEIHQAQFEEYTPEMRGISKGGKSGLEEFDRVTLTHIGTADGKGSLPKMPSNGNRHSNYEFNSLNSKKNDVPTHSEHSRSATLPQNQSHLNNPSSIEFTEAPKSNENHQASSLKRPSLFNFLTGKKSSTTPAVVIHSDVDGRIEEEADEGNKSEDNFSSDDNFMPTKMIVLYDYQAVEDDELSLKAGMVIDMVGKEDEQGWCTGRVNGRVGLYPAKYVKPLE